MPTSLLRHTDWTDVERAAYDAQAACPRDASAFLSPLLRRIRANRRTRHGQQHDTWSSGNGVRLETTDGPPCPTHPAADRRACGLGWKVEYKVCTCLGDHSHASVGCTIDFRDRHGRPVWYSNLKWGRTLDNDAGRPSPADQRRVRLKE
ncbi:hypothetical protein F6456_42055 [Streptomyces sp. LBUM 1484]|nr:hypothetical protein [Streptomyces sp. LBUM 1484]